MLAQTQSWWLPCAACEEEAAGCWLLNVEGLGQVVCFNVNHRGLRLVRFLVTGGVRHMARCSGHVEQT
jgi:hypothetical protein